ncbi:MAG: transaldolase family protein [Armatimonadetes bacterium]|nr:transaldolase family protein [Armatimonadota bacterium]
MNIEVGVHEDANLIQAVRELALEGYQGPGKPEYASREKYVWLRELTSRLWLDTGDAEAAHGAWSPEMEALTTNNTLVNQVVQTGAMDGLIGYGARKVWDARPDISENDLAVEVAFLVNARLALSLVHRFGAKVSVELHPDVAHDIEQIIVSARRYFEINPDYFYIKVPLTPDGFIAVRQLASEGIPINFTLGFSARQNYLAARFSRPRFVNVFLGRLNALVEENELGSPENVGEKAALASDEMVKSLRASNPEVRTHQIAASIRNGRQVVTLAGVDVLTIPPKAAREYLDMDVSKDDIYQRNWRDLEVNMNPDHAVDTNALLQLWEIDPRFISFVEDAVKQGDALATGRQLVDLARFHHVALFHDWTPEDRARIREKGKIPDLSQWPGVPVDDLMSVAALESFDKDQLELDERIKRVIRESGVHTVS